MAECLNVSNEIFEKIPGLIIITGKVAPGKVDNDAIALYLKSCWKNLTERVLKYGDKSLPMLSLWRKALRDAQINVKKFPPSIEAIAKRTMKCNEPFSVNPIVDAYNAISMALELPLGAYDISAIEKTLYLRTARHGEPFVPLGSLEKEETVEGEIVYSDAKSVLTRQFLWRQAEKAKITSNTKQFIFVCELLASMGDEILQNSKVLIQKKFAIPLNATITDFKVIRRD
jgi:DNA/RNA-binding domain of Phe-tRNA-synthetase-like protein